MTDFWGFGGGIAKRVANLGCFTMGDIARLSLQNEDALYKNISIKAETIIDHAWGWEPVDIATIKAYHPASHSLSSGQVLKEPYTAELGRLIVREMTELLVLDMVKKCVVTKKLTLTIGYDRASLILVKKGKTVKDGIYKVATTCEIYKGKVTEDRYHLTVPQHSHGTGNIDHWTSSTKVIVETVLQLLDRIIDRDLLIRRVTICAFDLIYERDIPENNALVQLDFFTDYEEIDRTESEKKAKKERERRL